MTEEKSEKEHFVGNRTWRTNDKILPLKGIQQLGTLKLDVKSPTFRAACDNLGVLPEECLIKYAGLQE